MKFSYHVYRQEKDILLAVADKDIMGKSFKENGLHIDVNEFYEGMEGNEEDVLNCVRGASIVNAVGKKIIKLLKDNDLVDNIIKVEGVPHAQIIKL